VFDHFSDDGHIILQVSIEGNYGIDFADLSKQPRQQRILMADIARQLEAADAFRVRG